MSEKLTQTFDDMEVLHKTVHSIEVHIDKEYQKLEIRMNPEKNNDISKELRFYMIDFLKNTPKNLKVEMQESFNDSDSEWFG